MAVTYDFPTSAALHQIAQANMPRLTADRPIFDILPQEDKDESMVIWEQYDNFKGLQQVRGMNGQPGRVKPTKLRQYSMTPGVYGEYEPLTEEELTTRRKAGTFGEAIDLSDIVLEKQNKLLERRLNRIEYIGWTLVTTGVFAVPNELGEILHTDSFPLQVFTATTAWSNLSSSTPLADFRAAKLLGRGYSVKFNQKAKAYVNQGTSNNILKNINASDLYGRRTTGLGTFNSLEAFSQLLMNDGLPSLVEYDEGYYDESDVFHTYIPDNTVVVVGERPAGQSVGKFQMTRNSNNPDLAPGAYMQVKDLGDHRVPRTIEVHDGFNGGPTIEFPSAIIIMNV